MSITKDQIIEAVAAMSVMDVVELISAMEELLARLKLLKKKLNST